MADDEENLQLLWRALEVLSVMIDNEDAKNKSVKGKQADMSPLQNCLISIVSKTRLSAGDDDDDNRIDLDDDRYRHPLVHHHLLFPIRLLLHLVDHYQQQSCTSSQMGCSSRAWAAT